MNKFDPPHELTDGQTDTTENITFPHYIAVVTFDVRMLTRRMMLLINEATDRSLYYHIIASTFSRPQTFCTPSFNELADQQ